MSKLIAAINMTIDGFCDHTAGIPDEELHQHYTGVLNHAGAIIYGRITYQLMEYWLPFVQHPSGKRSMDEFAVAIDRIPKIVFSHTLENVDWKSARLADKDIAAEVSVLKQKSDKDILVGSPSLIVQLTQLGLIDEYQLCVHPAIAGQGLPLFRNISQRMALKLVKTKTFSSGALVLYYEQIDEDPSTSK